MFFTLSKIFWALAQPANLLLVMMLVSALWLWFWPQSGRWFMTGLTAAFLAVAVLPLGEGALREIENTYPIPSLPDRVDGVIVLAGFVWGDGSAAHHQIQMGDKAERLTQFMVFAHRYPNAKLVFTGGSGNPMLQSSRESDWVKQLWTDIGLDPARVIWENQSRNTYENVVESKKLAQPQPGENWVLVTSALHMPRAVGIFEKQGWRVIPYPVDYITTNSPMIQREFSVSGNLWLLTEAMKEIIGKIAYQWTGKSE